MLLTESLQFVRCRLVAGAKMQAGFLVCPKFYCLLRPASQFWVDREQNGSVAITHVPFGPLDAGCRWRFFQRILRINRTVFRRSALRATAAAVYPAHQGPIQGGGGSRSSAVSYAKHRFRQFEHLTPSEVDFAAFLKLVCTWSSCVRFFPCSVR